MAAHGGTVIEIERIDGKWRVVPDSKYARRITAQTPMTDRRSRRGLRPAEDQGRSDRPGVARHDQQLRRRQHALGHVADLRGELQRLLLRQAARGRAGGKNYKRLGLPGNAYAWGRFTIRAST